MPRLPAAFGVMLTAAVCIGLAAFRYPQVNQQVWEMVQSGRQSATGGGGLLRLGLALPAEATVVRSAESDAEQVPSDGQGITSPAEASHDADKFAGLPVADYVGTDRGDLAGRHNTVGSMKTPLAQEEVIQITLAVPPQMAILSQTEPETPVGDSEPHQSKEAEADQGTKRDKLEKTATASGGLFAGRAASGWSVPEEEEVATKAGGELGVSRPNSRFESGPVSTFAASGEEDGAPKRDAVAASPDRDDFVDPPLVPIVKTGSPEKTTGGMARVSDFEVVTPHDAVARRAPSPPVVSSSDLPLVDIHRSPWFRGEKPQRLPPVEEDSHGGEGSFGPQGPWEWTPSIPLYPSTGR
ncbi:MAG: hypothetical protein ACUVQG_01500 [Thermogutta sp.]